MEEHKNKQNNNKKEKNESSDHHRNQQRQQKSPMRNTKKSAVWDCESSLYDSFELNSFNQQLDSAVVTARSLSMPRLPDSSVVEPKKKNLPKSSKLARSVGKVMRSVMSWMKPKASGFPVVEVKQKELETHGRLWKSGKDVGFGLEMIPEGCEESPAPEVGPGLRKAASERFAGHVGWFR